MIILLHVQFVHIFDIIFAVRSRKKDPKRRKKIQMPRTEAEMVGKRVIITYDPQLYFNMLLHLIFNNFFIIFHLALWLDSASKRAIRTTAANEQ